MGNVHNKGWKSERKVLTPEEAKKREREESRNRRHSIDEKILLINAQQVKQNNSIENTMLDAREEESKQRNLIEHNTIHSPKTHISISISLDETLHFASNTCASNSWGKAQIPNVEVEEDNAMLIEAGYDEYENLSGLLSGQFCEEFNHYVPNDANVAPQ